VGSDRDPNQSVTSALRGVTGCKPGWKSGAMSWQEELHPEVGYLLPSRKVRRLLRFAVLWAAFGIVVGATGTLALLAPRSESQSPESPAYGVAEAPPAEPEEPITAVSFSPATGGDVTGTAAAPRLRFIGRRANCLSLSVAIKNGACTFYRTPHTEMAAAPSPNISPAINSVPSPGADGGTPRSNKPRNTIARLSRRQNPALEASSGDRRAYASHGARYEDRPSFDRGGFW
jgi:hypothetical protein